MIKIVKQILAWRLEVAVFIAGAVVMIFELVGSRLLAPYLGASLITWTSLIGVILASLAAGYYWGGRLADKRADNRWLALILVVAGFFLLLALALQRAVLAALADTAWPLQWQSAVAAIVLLAPAGLCLGMVSPYAAKLKLTILSEAGGTVGRLYALSTLGSLAGTFGAGWWLVPLFGTTKILALLTAVLWLTAAWLFVDRPLNKSQWLCLALGLIFWIFSYLTLTPSPANIIDRDTAYSRVWIYDFIYRPNSEPARLLRLDASYSSAMFLNNDDLLFDYTKFYRLAGYFNPALDKAVMIGGAGYSYPKDFLRKFPRAELTVVEIDPGVTALARQYFRLPDDPRLIIKHEDGRVWLNQTRDKYDAIFVDAFSSSYAIPFQLTTKEAVEREYDSLNEDGVALVNIVAALNGEQGRLTRSMYYTYKKIFPQVYLLPVNSPQDGAAVQNIMLVALKAKVKPSFLSSDREEQSQLNNLWLGKIEPALPLTDNWAPTDYFASQTL